MGKRQFSDHERYAVYTVHGEKCYMCGVPVDLATMEVDHVIPEELIDDPKRLEGVLKDYGLPLDFNLQSFANWLPSCHPCNSRKRNRVLNPTTRIQLDLQIAIEKAAAAAQLADKQLSMRAVSKAWNMIKRANADGKLSEPVHLAILEFASFHSENRAPEMATKPMQLAPGLQVLSENGNIRLVSGPFGVGAGPIGPMIDSSFYCPNCGNTAWNGARCVNCGNMSHD